jgi:predicted ferric reductase
MKTMLLRAAIVLCLVIPSFLWAIELKAGLPFAVRLYDTGRLLALLGFVLILFQYVLSLKSRWVEKGIGLDTLFAMHKKYEYC